MGLPPNALSPPAENGLSGAPMATPAAQPEMTAPVVQGPATEGPANPGQSVALHIMEALGASTGKPMDWARGILSGALAGAANVGTAPSGAGWLYGASKGVQGQMEVRRQQMLDQQKVKQQAFENDLKAKQDA